MKTFRRAQYFSGQAILLGTCILLIGLTAVLKAEASSVIFKHNIITVQVGRTFTLPIVVDPTGFRQYTVRLFITFPPDLLEVTSFTFGQNWLAVPQPGYDSLNNKRGELVKTGGFPAGFSSPVLFGTITFRAKGPGDSAIIVGSQSFVLDAENRSTLESKPQVRVIATEGSAPKASSIKPLPNLPPGEKNIFDISLAPGRKLNPPKAGFFILLFIVAVLLGSLGRIIFTRLRHRLLIKKINHDKDFKN